MTKFLLYQATAFLLLIIPALFLRLMRKLELVQILLVAVSTILGLFHLSRGMKSTMPTMAGVLVLCGLWIFLFFKNGRIRDEKLKEPKRRRLEIIAITIATLAVVSGVVAPLVYKRIEQKQRNRLPSQIMEALNRDSSPVLYSIDPDLLKMNNDVTIAPSSPEGPFFHDYKILGKTALSSSDQRQAIVTSLTDEMSSWDGSMATCFNPRHGLRVKGDSGFYDFVICFQCSKLHLFSPNDRKEGYGIASDARVFNEVLAALKIPLAKE